MKEKYNKYIVTMNLEKKEYAYWQSAEVIAYCYVESYKEKRAIYFKIENLLPSKGNKMIEGKEYHLLLMGESHKDLGQFSVDSEGKGFIYKTFTGEQLEAYSYCLLVCFAPNQRADIIMKGKMPFYREEFQEDPPGMWDTMVKKGIKMPTRALFSLEEDETGATWHIIPWEESQYGHCAIGVNKEEEYFVAIPGRFMKEEQTEMNGKQFTLWQPLKGAENFYKDYGELDGNIKFHIYGYWIAQIDLKNDKLIML